jgi:transcriptional regulator with XRE-family HTH domain
MTDREEGLRAQGRKLAAWRASQVDKEGRRLSQVAAAQRLGASQGAWAAWELGRKSPDPFFAGAIEALTKGKLQVRARDWVFRRGPARADRVPEAKAS